MSRRDPRPLLAKLAKERDEARAELVQVKYEAKNLREILEAYQEHVSAARRPTEGTAGSSPTQKTQIDEISQQLSVSSSRNAVLQAEIDAKNAENASLRDIMNAMRDDLRNANDQKANLEKEHDERLALIAEQLESLKKNARRARVDRRAAERRMAEAQHETEALKEQIALQDAQLARQAQGDLEHKKSVEIATDSELKRVREELKRKALEREQLERLLERGEIELMAGEDRAAQRAEIHMLEAELRAIKQAEAEERVGVAVENANIRARQAEQQTAQQTAARVRAEKERDIALQQLFIIQERFGIANQSGPEQGKHMLKNYGTAGSSASGLHESALERQFKLIGGGEGNREELRAALLHGEDSPLVLAPGDLQGLGGGLQKEGNTESCCCVVS